MNNPESKKEADSNCALPIEVPLDLERMILDSFRFHDIYSNDISSM